MNRYHSGLCPVCGEKLQISRLSCPSCQAEFPQKEPLNRYAYLSEDELQFLETFLSCRGSLKDVQAALGISYPTARRKLDELLKDLGLSDTTKEEERSMGFFQSLFNKPADYPPPVINPSSAKASDIVHRMLLENGGQATVHSARGIPYVIVDAQDGRSFLCDQLPLSPPYEYRVFDIIVDLLAAQGGRARKGNGRNYKLGYGDCTLDTVVGAIGKNYAGKSLGSSVFDPVFVLAAILEWAGIAHNERGYLALTAEYRAKLDS